MSVFIPNTSLPVLGRKNENTVGVCSVKLKLIPEKWQNRTLPLSTGVVLHSVGHCTCVVSGHVWLDSASRISWQPFRLQAGWTCRKFLVRQHAVRSAGFLATSWYIRLLVSRSNCLISCGSWDCGWSETAFQTSPSSPQFLPFVLCSAGQVRPVQGVGPDPRCWPLGGTGPEPVRPGLDPAASAYGFPDWAELRFCQRCRCCSRLARSALWTCSRLCCRCAGNDGICSHINIFMFYTSIWNYIWLWGNDPATPET